MTSSTTTSQKRDDFIQNEEHVREFDIENFSVEAEEIKRRYPKGNERSALIPMLHLVQAYEGYVSNSGIKACAKILGITEAEVSAVATFYSQFKRHPNGQYTIGVCTNSLCAVMGGDEIFECVSKALEIGHDQTSADGKITLEAVECNAACDYAPVIMVNWEFFDNQTPETALKLVRDIQAGKQIHPTRGPEKVHTFKEISRTLAGFEDGLVDEGVSAGESTLLGKRIYDSYIEKNPNSNMREGEK
ncbi:NADH-quinone oxidoreductase subunit NuoE [Actinomyces sp. zg-332]|uniref:NADH-quinone oxidoreductase subunit NuoE n=1 Tax=Actinomyces sp. zg-332 TaxID=2708340 RepID=UPI00141E5125|nr:NADH-quinone oxidoreductase subunit NuoE [Actinomyces sp. zg-332]QPK94020.1 NADH-quinone oxidoreductase subunit NuoE [Actinomyces sp. zg-332]